MRAVLGWFTFLLTIAFATGLFVTLARFGTPMNAVVLGFVGFGIATIASCVATTALWAGFKRHEKLLGWTGTMAGILCGLVVLMGLAGVVFSPEDVGDSVNWWSVNWWLLVRLIGLGVTAAVFGGYGISMLYKAEGLAA